MTFEEAKRQIKELSDIQMELFDKTSDRKIYGEARAYEEAGHILDEIDTEPVGNPDKLTLKELARELRKIFKFDYLTCDNGSEVNDICLWKDLPYFKRSEWFGQSSDSITMFVEVKTLAIDLDLSEYRDADGNIDYSKCIVEVE